MQGLRIDFINRQSKYLQSTVKMESSDLSACKRDNFKFIF